ncbi:MAG: DUF4071 domain-containing protein [bacterium]|nr:DUF4071 domain-containing protein [bacterium]
MTWNDKKFEKEFAAAVEKFDRLETENECRRLIEHLRATVEPYDAGAAKKILGHLQRKRYFDLLQRVADAFQQTGLRTPRVRRQYAQALLDQGGLSAALPFLENLAQETAKQPDMAFEHSEARGLLGRAYKQIYIDTDNPKSPEARDALKKAIDAYHSVYEIDKSEHTWHGINSVALLRRAATDGVPIAGFDDPEKASNEIAEKILEGIETKWDERKASMWDSGTALEACVALSASRPEDEARVWLNRYVREPNADAFELASTLRQLVEVWRLDVESEPGASLLPVLRAELLAREGGGFEVKPDQLKAGKLEGQPDANLEKILGKVRYVSYKFMLRAIERARAVSRIEHQPGQGFGTGFIVRGGDLHDSLGDELMLLTNSHVVSEDPLNMDALRPDAAIVTFQLLKEEDRADDEYAVTELVWSSPPGELDASLLRLEKVPDGLEAYPVAPRLPLADGDQRVYVIGHPKGGSLSFSIQDNVLLDHEAPRLHYRAPTEGGSSGSPIFNSQWKLIGLHHAGGKEMLRLNRKEGTYDANEGLWIQSVREKMKADPQKIL